ncbi:MAG: RDD family protein [Defluviitaleaceae bacterium]|nr:RDD family protein [Defluviitaleaceae bacterium]
MLLLKRIMANMVDISVFLIVVILAFMYVDPQLSQIFGNSPVVAGILLVMTVVGTFILQYQFFKVNQTIGKAFFRLVIVSSNDARPLTPGIIIQRELLGKLCTGYLICIPVLWGAQGNHDIATETKVISK